MKRRVATIAATALVALLGGCYEHVVKETGVGSGRRSIYEPNVSDADTNRDQWNRTSKSEALAGPGGSTGSLTQKKPGTFTFEKP